MLMRGHTQSSNVLSDYCDGSIYKTHPLFSEDPRALQLILYYNDVEVCNPLGSRAKTHKVGDIFINHMKLYYPTASFVLLHT